LKRALVCGAGGFIGDHLVNKLKRAGYWVRGVDIKKEASICQRERTRRSPTETARKLGMTGSAPASSSSCARGAVAIPIHRRPALLAAFTPETASSIFTWRPQWKLWDCSPQEFDPFAAILDGRALVMVLRRCFLRPHAARRSPPETPEIR